jgi:hypothetical protein
MVVYHNPWLPDLSWDSHILKAWQVRYNVSRWIAEP